MHIFYVYYIFTVEIIYIFTVEMPFKNETCFYKLNLLIKVKIGQWLSANASVRYISYSFKFTLYIDEVGFSNIYKNEK